MNTHLKPLALTLGLGLLHACTPNDSTTGGMESGTGGTTGDATTGDPGTTTDAPTTGPGTGDDTTTDPGTTGEPTTDASSSTSASSTTDDTTTGALAGLCDRLGGEAGINELVGGFIGVVVLDDRINGYFLNQDVDTGSMHTLVGAQLAGLAGCEGAVYGGMNMKDAHAGMGISAQDFIDFVGDFEQALGAHAGGHPDLTDTDRAAVLDIFAGFEADVVEDLENNLTVYQRVGRKPAIEALVGGPDDPTSFIGLVLANDAINTYFTMTMVDRFHTCLTRQLGAIDGPIVYGAEVDSPGPGIDEGVAFGDECRDMAVVHGDLQDAQMTYITVDDFSELVGDLVEAMTIAGVSDADRTVILDAFGPLCDPIVVGSEEKNKCPGNSKQETVELTALAQPLLDNAYDGTLETMLCNDIVVPADPGGIELVSAVELKLGLDHPWIGDVNVKVQSPAGVILSVFNRPGLDPMPDDGTKCCNDSSDFNKEFPIVIKNGGAFDAGKMGTTIGANEIVCKDDKQCEFKSNPGGGPGLDFGDFLGETAAGTWKVCVGDSNADDLGTLDHVALTFTKVKYDPQL